MPSGHICSFCYRAEEETRILFFGVLVSICDVCIESAMHVLSGMPAETATASEA